MRGQSIDLGVYRWSEGKLTKFTVVEDIEISSVDKMTENVFSSPIDLMPLAFFPNANNKGYCRIVLDHQSLECFVKGVD